MPAQTTPAALNRRKDPVLEVHDLRTHFFTRRGIGKAVDGVNLTLYGGRTLGLVGESGSGKSMTALSILQLHPAPAARVVGGKVIFRGKDLLQQPSRELRRIRGDQISYVPQDALAALDALFTIRNQLAEAIRIHRDIDSERIKELSVALLRQVHIPAASERMSAYPHELSGGMRQRVVSAMGIACDPVILIADEPTTSLDVTIQAVYLDVLREVQRSRDLSILFITHDFGIVADICDDVAVMYAGRVVEQASVQELFARPSHPYTSALLNSLFDVSDTSSELISIPGQPPSMFEEHDGCPFAPRCSFAQERCTKEYPPTVSLGPDHEAACWSLVSDG